MLRRDSEDLTLRDLPRPVAERLKPRKVDSPAKPGMAIPFTGHLIICRGGWHADFFERIFDAKEAFELEFDEGILAGALDLGDFVRAGRAHIDSMPRDKDGRLSDLDLLRDYDHMMEVMATLTVVLPRGSYTGTTYVWRSDRPGVECVLCSALGKAN